MLEEVKGRVLRGSVRGRFEGKGVRESEVIMRGKEEGKGKGLKGSQEGEFGEK